jgi:hypothetical protein
MEASMDYRKIEQTELSVSRLYLGTMMFGGETAMFGLEQKPLCGTTQLCLNRPSPALTPSIG